MGLPIKNKALHVTGSGGLKGLGKLKSIQIISSGLEPATFRLVAQRPMDLLMQLNVDISVT
jgi:hypothetical protein